MTMAASTVSPLQILLIEDNPGDVRLIKEALRSSRYQIDIVTMADGVEGLEYLRSPGREHPDLILLDLNLPRRHGREVLADLKADPALARIPVVILTSSDAQQDVLACYDLHANCYVRKPVNLRDLFATVQSIEDFWFGTAVLPEH